MKESTVTSDILNLDPLLTAEKLTGKSYKEDKETALLGMFINQMKSKVVANFRQSEKDTYYQIGWDEFKNLIVERGFTIDYQNRFEYEEGRKPEEIIAHWGFVLLHATSFQWSHKEEETLNGGYIYFQTVGNLSNIFSINHISGGCTGHLDIPGDYDQLKIMDKNLDRDRFIFGGQFDVRDGLFSFLDGLDAISRFIPIEKKQFIWCLNYGETKVKGYDVDKITRSKIHTVPMFKTVIPLMWRD
jgi:hypothetical protein